MYFKQWIETYPSKHAPGSISNSKGNGTKPRLWCDKTPILYKLRSTLMLEGQKLDETVTTFGIRSLKFYPDSGLFVNGRSAKLKGVCLHQDAGSFGNAVPIAIWAYRLSLLKKWVAMPFERAIILLLRSFTISVISLASMFWRSLWWVDTRLALQLYWELPWQIKIRISLYFNQWYETDLRSMLRRDRNHPCVILYSIGNEIPNQLNDDGWKMAKNW